MIDTECDLQELLRIERPAIYLAVENKKHYEDKQDFFENCLKVWAYFFRSEYCTKRCKKSNSCQYKTNSISLDEIDETWISKEAGRKAYEKSIERSKKILSKNAGYIVGEKAAKWHALINWKAIAREGKLSAIESSTN